MARENDPRIIATAQTLERVEAHFEFLRRDELERRYPQIAFEDMARAIYEPASGALMARRAVQSVADFVARNGGDYLIGSALAPAVSATGSGQLNEVITRGGSRIRAGGFVFACRPRVSNTFHETLETSSPPPPQEIFLFRRSRRQNAIPPAADADMDRLRR